MRQYQYFFMLGREPLLSASEAVFALERAGLSPTVIFGDAKVLLVSLSETLPIEFLNKLGGTMRIAQVVGEQPTPWQADYLLPYLPGSDKKIRLGVSTINFIDSSLARNLKIALQERGDKVRLILPRGKKSFLNTAQITFNKLLAEPHRELILVRGPKSYFAAQTTHVQDLESYTQRDTERAHRDAVVGMLPPRLAQMMLNLTLSSLPSDINLVILDPFCGLGTVLQEGWLSGYQMTGSDINPKMAHATRDNLKEIADRLGLDSALSPTVLQHDATQSFPKNWHKKFDAIVTEPYLGKPLNKALTKQEWHETTAQLGKLYAQFFRQAKAVLKPHGVILFVLPRFKVNEDGRKALWPFPSRFIDEIGSFGYARLQLVPTSLAPWYGEKNSVSLMYARPDALVGRELVLFQLTS